MATDPRTAVEDVTLDVGNERWQGRSVLTEGAGWQWVRLAHVGVQRYLVLMKIAPNADERDAVRALEWWLQSPGREDGDVIEVS